MSASAQEYGCASASPAVSGDASQNHSKNETPYSPTTITPITTESTVSNSSSPSLHATTATFATAELLEHILSYLSALQLLKAKDTCRSFCNAIESSPSLRRRTSTFLRLGDVDESDLFKTDAGGEVVYPVNGLETLAFFYPSDGERRLFVRVSVEKGWFGRVGKGSGLRTLGVVDKSLGDVRVGWHCSCFEEGRGEGRVACEDGRVTFGDAMRAMEGEHRARGRGECGSLVKFWVDGLWKQSEEMRDLAC